MFTLFKRSLSSPLYCLLIFTYLISTAFTARAFPTPALTISVEGTNIELEWRIKHDEKVGSFELERSLNGEEFISLGSQQLIQNKKYGIIYTYTDMKAIKLGLPKFFYRLKHTALSGEVSFSEIREVSTSSHNKELSVIGHNKSGKQKYTIHFKGHGKVNMSVLSMLGEVKFKQNYSKMSGAKTIHIFTENWKPGSYIIDLKQGKKRSRYKFILK